MLELPELLDPTDSLALLAKMGRRARALPVRRVLLAQSDPPATPGSMARTEPWEKPVLKDLRGLLATRDTREPTERRDPLEALESPATTPLIVRVLLALAKSPACPFEVVLQ
ncbi:hypothetical protein L596_027277 [Steinernema carpocapsae]|uniref:Uncharacterized protein n=1 Tax=Steinernema carpocapsae TaxID=34508 RepID=A0A4V5ZYF0_STECR|nr:hypothetical protein L596_027277 [Steinernema carpocapsae]